MLETSHVKWRWVLDWNHYAQVFHLVNVWWKIWHLNIWETPLLNRSVLYIADCLIGKALTLQIPVSVPKLLWQPQTTHIWQHPPENHWISPVYKGFPSLVPICLSSLGTLLSANIPWTHWIFSCLCDCTHIFPSIPSNLNPFLSYSPTHTNIYTHTSTASFK